MATIRETSLYAFVRSVVFAYARLGSFVLVAVAVAAWISAVDPRQTVDLSRILRSEILVVSFVLIGIVVVPLKTLVWQSWETHGWRHIRTLVLLALLVSLTIYGMSVIPDLPTITETAFGLRDSRAGFP